MHLMRQRWKTMHENKIYWIIAFNPHKMSLTPFGSIFTNIATNERNNDQKRKQFGAHHADIF